MTVPRADIRRAAGQLIIAGFESSGVSPELREVMREVGPLGLILFNRNYTSVEHAESLTRELKSLRRDEPVLLSVDQEGGRVARLRAPCTEWPPMQTLGAADDEALAEAVGAAIGREMRALHFDVDFAPVLDVNTNPDNPIIGHRAFSDDPKKVARLGAAFIRGMQGVGVSSCGKHFPGHGDTQQDSHLTLPELPHTVARLETVEWPPFAAAIAAKVAAIMTAHVVVHGVDAKPATISKAALAPLRERWGFDGVVISDDIEMRGIADSHTPEQLAPLALAAGVDVFLACRQAEVVLALYRGIIQAHERGEVSTDDLLAKARRATAWRATYYRPPAAGNFRDVLGHPKHQALAARLSEYA